MRCCVCCAAARFRSQPKILAALEERTRAVAAPLPQVEGEDWCAGELCWPMPVRRTTLLRREGYVAGLKGDGDDSDIADVSAVYGVRKERVGVVGRRSVQFALLFLPMSILLVRTHNDL